MGQRGNLVERRRLAVEMHRNHRSGAAWRRRLEGSLQRRRVHAKPAVLDIDQDRGRAGALDRGDGGHRGVRHGKDQIARADPAGAQALDNSSSVGAVAAADTVRDADKPGKPRLERASASRPMMYSAAIEHLRDRGVDRRLGVPSSRRAGQSGV